MKKILLLNLTALMLVACSKPAPSLQETDAFVDQKIKSVLHEDSYNKLTVLDKRRVALNQQEKNIYELVYDFDVRKEYYFNSEFFDVYQKNKEILSANGVWQMVVDISKGKSLSMDSLAGTVFKFFTKDFDFDELTKKATAAAKILFGNSSEELNILVERTRKKCGQRCDDIIIDLRKKEAEGNEAAVQIGLAAFYVTATELKEKLETPSIVSGTIQRKFQMQYQ